MITAYGETFRGYNKPKRTPRHKTKSHAVLAKVGSKVKLIRFGQQGVKGAGKNPTSKRDKARKRSYYARHNAQDPNPSKMSARYWSIKLNEIEQTISDVENLIKTINFGEGGVMLKRHTVYISYA